MSDPRLGRVPPKDFKHVEKYPLRTTAVAAFANPVPVGIGVNWYAAFYADRLIQRRNRGRLEWWVTEGDLGPLMGGHAITLEPFHGPHRDIPSWWQWHDQVSEGICVSEMTSRVLALLNRKRYQPRPVYDLAQTIDYWDGEDYDGTSVDAGLAVIRTYGAIPAKPGEPHYIAKHQVEGFGTTGTRPWLDTEGIAANRWVTDDDDLFRALGDVNAEYAVWLNSWGKSYPQRVKVPRSVLSRLRQEDGEMGIVTDR